MRLANAFEALRQLRAHGRSAWSAELARLRSILDTLSTDFEKTSFLRTYTGKLIALGLIDFWLLDTRISKLYRSVDFESFDLSVFFPLFKNHTVPAECGLTTYFYIKLLQRCGFKAYQYSFGFNKPPHQRCVHSVTLVEIVFNGTKRLIIQDPYLNLTYRHRDTDPLDFFDFLSALKRRDYGFVVMDSPPVTTTLLVPDVTLYEQHLTCEDKQAMLDALQQPDGQIKTKLTITRDYATLMQSPSDNLENEFLAALRDHGHRQPFLYAYTFRASPLVGDFDWQQIQGKIDAILR